MFKRGDDVVTVPSLWHDGVDIGERLATVIRVEGHIWINVHQYNNNPVKVFSYEIKSCNDAETRLMSDYDIDYILEEFFPGRNKP